jgi:hypothetical protein
MPKRGCQPSDLENPALEYSGIYEDGWVAEDSFVKLIERGPGALRIAGMTPMPSGRVRVSMDDATVFESEVKPGSFDWNIDVPVKLGPHKIRIQFKKSRPLSIP